MPDDPSYDFDRFACDEERSEALKLAAWYRDNAALIATVVSGVSSQGAPYAHTAKELVDFAVDLVAEITSRGSRCVDLEPRPAGLFSCPNGCGPTVHPLTPIAGRANLVVGVCDDCSAMFRLVEIPPGA